MIVMYVLYLCTVMCLYVLIYCNNIKCLWVSDDVIKGLKMENIILAPDCFLHVVLTH